MSAEQGADLFHDTSTLAEAQSSIQEERRYRISLFFSWVKNIFNDVVSFCKGHGILAITSTRKVFVDYVATSKKGKIEWDGWIRKAKLEKIR